MEKLRAALLGSIGSIFNYGFFKKDDSVMSSLRDRGNEKKLIREKGCVFILSTINGFHEKHAYAKEVN
ncbi:hypothetical protein L1049_026874 [Liquidambar formosana]|uniref:Uncharacterized protein n=1 Tax=Liquidambar formosana TaxID=63359 RepID=A0AAP0NH69_LIQFO